MSTSGEKTHTGVARRKGAGAEVELFCVKFGLAGNHNRFHVVAGLRRAIGCHPHVFG